MITLLKQPGSGDPVRASVNHLLSRAYGLPCSTAAQAFSQLVQPTSRFQLALDALLPLLDPNASAELAQRILGSFILYSLYAPHPIAINPFKSALFFTFVKEREQAVRVANGGGVSENEQLVWVLWKILKGDGNDIGPYSPSTLARSPLPPKLRASNLTLDEEIRKAELNTLNKDDLSHHSQRNDPSHKATSASDDPASQDTATASSTKTNVEASKAQVSTDDGANVALAMQLLLAARERVLTLSEQRILNPMIPQLTSPPMITSLDLSPLISHNPTLAHPLFVALLTTSSASDSASVPRPPGLSTWIDVLPFLPPTLPTFDLLGRLLRDHSPVGNTTVADLVHAEALGRFIHESINWLDRAEKEEREGLISDDRFPKGVQNLCRFYNSLIKLSIVDPTSDADSAEMAHFSLRNARFEEAQRCWVTLAMGKL
jgi:hypothetical protein